LTKLSAGVGLVVNCVGISHDGGQGGTCATHRDFVTCLIAAQSRLPNCPLLVHVSLPGHAHGQGLV
jgi:hypothetical protein